jgi:hypothetical protein
MNVEIKTGIHRFEIILGRIRRFFAENDIVSFIIFIAIQVIAPPEFILRLPPYTGAMAEVSNFSIECQVECSPLCEIVWLKDGVAINEDDERYNIIFGEKPPNPAKNDFESMYSSLNFNIHR